MIRRSPPCTAPTTLSQPHSPRHGDMRGGCRSLHAGAALLATLLLLPVLWQFSPVPAHPALPSPPSKTSVANQTMDPVLTGICTVVPPVRCTAGICQQQTCFSEMSRNELHGIWNVQKLIFTQCHPVCDSRGHQAGLLCTSAKIF